VLLNAGFCISRERISDSDILLLYVTDIRLKRID